MADIEDRITKHSHAFEGLLSLVPVGEKRKFTKDEKRKAKKAKIDLRAVVIDKGKIIREGKKENKKKAEGPVAAGATVIEAAEKQDGREKKKQRKQKPKSKKQQKADSETPTVGDGDEDGTGDTEAEGGRATGRKKLEPKSPSKKSKVKTLAQPKELPQKSPQKPPKSPRAPSKKLPKTSKDLPVESAPGSSSDNTADTTPSSPSTTTTTPDPESNIAETAAEAPTPKLEVSPAERAEARARLAAHIIALRSKRKADGADGTTTKPRHALLEARQKKEASRKERKKALRIAAKLIEESSPSTDTPSLVRPPPVEVESQPKNDFMFGAVTFDDGQELDHTLADFKKTRKRKGPTDVMGQLRHVEAKKARLESMDPEKAEKIHEKEMWSRALKQTAGEKVRDDEKLLKKALKRQQGEKKKSEREWKERKGTVAKGIAMRQKKREGNINARKEQKKLGKAGKKAKTGGKKKVQKKDRKGGSRPGSEGGIKSGKPAGKPAGKPTGKSSGGGGGKRFG